MAEKRRSVWGTIHWIWIRVGALAGIVFVSWSLLANLDLPVTRVYGPRDTVADVEKVLAARCHLPPQTRDVRIDGGNHSQFGYSGFQPGDWPARAQQQALTLDAVVETLDAISNGSTVPAER